MGDTLVCRGKARCSSDDTFDETVGRRIAECRAKIKMFKVARNVWKTLGNDLAERVLSCRTLSNTCDVAMDIETWHLKKLLSGPPEYVLVRKVAKRMEWV